jgi:hypothetical protein
MKKSKVKQIFQQLIIAVVVVGFFNISSHAERIEANNSEIYELGGHGRLHISLEHHKEKDGYTPVLISTGGLRILKWMDRNGSVRDRIGYHSGYQTPLFRIDLNEWRILSGMETIPFEITVQDNIRTRMRIYGKEARAVITVDKDRKNGQLFLFNGSTKPANLRFKRGEPANGKEVVKIFGAGIRGTGKFIFEEDSKIIYSLKEYKRLERAKERAQKKASAASLRQGKSISSLERQALIALYNYTNGDSWWINSGWKDPPLEPDGFAAIGSEGTWYGITVESDHVTQIDLRWNGLTGTIPIELGNLSNLTGLILWTNFLSGSIPSELGNLSNLETLELDSNYLIGSIPPELGNLSSLKYLVLYANQLTGSIPPELENLSNLEYLVLFANDLSGSIPPELGNLSNLRYLWIYGNNLSGSIPPELGNLSNLEDLDLNDNTLSGSIPAELGNLSNLEELWLDWNSLSGSIPAELGNLSNLLSFYLNGNKISGEIPTSLTNLTNLYDANIGYNALYTNDGTLITFLNEKDPDWAETQTIAPTGVSTSPYDATSIRVSWTPITYSSDPGGCMVSYSTIPGGPYTYFDITTDKTASSMIVTGLTPGTGYYFVVQTRTEAHTDNPNTVESEYSTEVSVDENPDIHVKLKNKNVLNGSTINAGRRTLSFIVGYNIPFTIQNLGFQALDLTGSPGMVTISGPGAKFFMVTQQPAAGTIAPGGSTTFKIRTRKTTVPNVPDGWQKDIEFSVNIPNSDPDEDPYTFTITMKVVK